MAVQAEYPSDVLLLPETAWTRMRNLLHGDEKCFVPVVLGDDTAPDFKMLPAAPSSGICNQILPSYPLQGSIHGGMASSSCGAFHVVATAPELNNGNMWICNNNNQHHRGTQRKRLREADQLGNFGSFEGANANSLNMPLQSNAAAAAVAVSTGLCLTFEDNQPNTTGLRELFSNNTSNNPHHNGNAFFSSNNLVAAEIQRQRNEIDQFLRLQEEHMRQSLMEKTEKHSKALVHVAAMAVCRKLREKEMQVMNMKRKNMELEEKIRGLTVESLAWQNRAKSSEAMAQVLKEQIDQKSKEGSGDSEEEAMAMLSSCQNTNNNINNNNVNTNIYIENRELEMQMRCRLCRSNDVSILLLPCRHLCLCKHCDTKLDACPICSSFKSASVQIYMS